MIDLTTLVQSPAQFGWDTFVAAGQQAMYTAFSFICEMIMVALVFFVLIGVLFTFTHYHKSGPGMIVTGIAGMIIISCAYMAILGASGPPDISIWFRPPA
jgi:hypothetical protein